MTLMIALFCHHLNGCTLKVDKFASMEACQARLAELSVSPEHGSCVDLTK
jgi:hypothetical protein